MATDSTKSSGTTEPEKTSEATEAHGDIEASDVKTKEDDPAARNEAEAADDTTDEDSLDLDDDPADAGSAEARAKAASNTNVLAGWSARPSVCSP